MFGIEDSQISKSLLPYLNETMLRRNEFAPIRLMKTNLKDKMSRAGSIQARMRAGGVRFDKSTDWYDAKDAATELTLLKMESKDGR